MAKGDNFDTGPFVPLPLPENRPLIEYVRVYSSLSPYGLFFEFRPRGLENWTETIEGDTTVDVLIDERTMERLSEVYDGPFSLIISLVASGPIKRRVDVAYAGAGGGFAWVNNAYDSYYVTSVQQEGSSKEFRITAAGAKEYLGKRLAIPAVRDTDNGVISVPDGSQAAKPIPASQILRFDDRTVKGIIAGLIGETATLQPLPIYSSGIAHAGGIDRTYLLKDMRTIKEAIDNLIDDQVGGDVIFDGGYGTRNNVAFLFSMDTSLERGTPITTLNTRTSEIFMPVVEYARADSVNNLWTVGNASDGNIILGHKIEPAAAGKVLLQAADMRRNDIQTPAFLLEYTLGILDRAGSAVRTMSLNSGLTPKMFLAYAGNYLYIRSPERPEIDQTHWLVVERTIDMKNKRIQFELEEWVLDNNGNGIPDRDEGLLGA